MPLRHVLLKQPVGPMHGGSTPSAHQSIGRIPGALLRLLGIRSLGTHIRRDAARHPTRSSDLDVLIRLRCATWFLNNRGMPVSRPLPAVQAADLDGEPSPHLQPITAPESAPWSVQTVAWRSAAFLAVLLALWKLLAAHS